MPTLDPSSWSQRDRDNLDHHITGNWEGQFEGDVDGDEPEPMRLVYIRFEPGANVWHIHDARTEDMLDHECGSFGSIHGAVEYCTDNDWDVRDGPVAGPDDAWYEDEEPYNA